MFGKLFKQAILFIFLAELFSLCAFLLPDFMPFGFFVILLLALILSLKKLEYGLYILLAELFIGSKGYLFSLSFNGLEISIRIALWLVFMSAFIGELIICRKKLKNSLNLKKTIKENGFLIYFIILFVFIAWGALNGILNKNDFSDLFFDLNGWLFFGLLLPVYYLVLMPRTGIERNNRESELLQLFSASIIWLSLKSLFLLYIFSHNMIGMIEEVYRWVRVSGVGEITLIEGGFYRVFFQSHIFVLIGSFVLLFKLLDKILNLKIKGHKLKAIIFNKEVLLFFTVYCLLMSVNLLSFSRSNWVGLAVGLFVGFGYVLFRMGWKKVLLSLALLTCSFVFALGLIVGTVKFPYPDPLGGFSTGDLLSRRATELAGEAALNSRWALFPGLWGKIKEAPIMGQGFGTTLTYISSDPRVLEQDPKGEYTTFAFEWGWMDIWLKLGIFGLIAYIALLFKISITGLGYKDEARSSSMIPALGIGIIVMSAVSFFSPYMNHPLGIGYILLAVILILNKQKGDYPTI